MSTSKSTPKDTPPQALTLNDITISWKEGAEDRRLDGQEIAILLAMFRAEAPEGTPKGLVKYEDIGKTIADLGWFLNDLGHGASDFTLCGEGLTAFGSALRLLGARAAATDPSLQDLSAYTVTVAPAAA